VRRDLTYLRLAQADHRDTASAAVTAERADAEGR